uniref:zinc finger protein 501-like n=1 Tax=Gasterosteus aculeatus aculeatus TaxID=481459 RepID=UPI001A980733|nr:zinc finger protein 501-like [Gasterosteus aculeatus aculeatus]XP_040050647.1 zinc finger protein 501-like [Gasterosteus aculeatus aculeatus]
MSSVHGLREFVNERLSAAAEEIFGAFKRTIVEYQEEIDRQRGLLDVIWKPEVRLHRIELPQSRVCKEEEVLCDQQLCLQERNPSLDQEDPDPPQIKEEQEELCSSQEGEQLEPKQEADTFTLTPTSEETDHSDDETPFWNPDRSQSESETEPPASTCTTWLDEEIDCERFVVPEPNNTQESHSQDQKGVKQSLTSDKEPQQQILAPPGDKTFLCETCGNYFQHKKTLLAHVRKVHRVDQPYVCTCGKRFIHDSVFQIHKRVHSDEKPFSCKTCGKDFKFSSGLKGHMLIHTGERPFSCNTCGKTFTLKSHLKFHTRIHSGEKPYSCTTCGKTFPRRDLLKFHTRIHTGERPYSCITCGKTFTQTSHLKSHIRIHSGEKPYSCTTCGKTFTLKSRLKYHTRNHTGERPYSCITCGKTFSRTSNLKSHIRIHTGEKPYSCKICKSGFRSSSNLNVHMRRSHKDETL